MLGGALGLVLSLAVAAVAFRRSGVSNRTFYEGEVYHMGPLAHARYMSAFVVCAVLFAAALAWPRIPVTAIWAAFVLIALLYGTTFLRGFEGEDE